jgi:hypothetical protein
MKMLLFSTVFAFWLLAGCSGDKSCLDNARFEIEQGNVPNAKKLLLQIPEKSPFRASADSLLKTIENR